MRLTEFCLREGRLTWLLLFLIVGGGLWAFLSLPAREDPPFVFRFAMITAVMPGASAPVVDQTITRVLEAAALELPEVEYTEGESREGVAQIVVKLGDRYDRVEPVWDKLERKLNEAKSSLPPGTRAVRLNRHMGQIFGVLIGFSSDADERFLLTRELRVLGEAFRKYPEVEAVEWIGEEEAQVVVELDVESLVLSGIAPETLPGVIASQNQPLPGGTLPAEDGGGYRYVPSGGLESVEDLRRLPVPLIDEETTLPLADVAAIRREGVPPRERIRVKGQEGIVLAIALAEDARIQDFGPVLERHLAEWRAAHGERFPAVVLSNEPGRVEEKLNGLFGNLLQSLLIVSLILVLLLGWREGLAVAFLIPLAFLFAFLILKGSGQGLNHVAVGGFIVVLGLLVDNNIVVAERILRHRREGQEPFTAAIEAVRELHRPLLVAALTTVLAFLPIFLAESAAGEYTRPLFMVVAITLLSAEFIVFTITPLLSCRFFGSRGWISRGPGNKRRHPLYRRVLKFAIRQRFWTMGAALLILAVTAWGLPHLPVRFFPPSDRPILLGELQMPPGTALEETAEQVGLLEERLQPILEAEPGIESHAWFIGRNPPRFVLNHRARELQPEHATLFLSLKTVRDMERLAELFEREARGVLEGGGFRVHPLEVGPAIGYPVQIRLKGSDLQLLKTVSRETEEQLEGIPGVVRTGRDWGRTVEGFRLDIDAEEAARHGIEREQVAGVLQAAFGGLPVSRVVAKDSFLPVVLRVTPPVLSAPEAVLDLEFRAPRDGRFYPLRDLADLEAVSAPPVIRRHSGERAITVYADPQKGVSPAEIDDALVEWVKGKEEGWAAVGLGWEPWGEALQAREANRSLLEKVPLAALLIFGLLLYQMKSLRRTLIVLLTIPLGFAGSVLGLFLTGESLSFMSLIGLVSLGGIVVNSALLIQDRIRLNCAAGHPPLEAVLDGAEQRYRAIFLTSVTTIGGMLPLLIFGGAFWRPMAAALVFGLGIGTLLILIVVPVMTFMLFCNQLENKESDGS